MADERPGEEIEPFPWQLGVYDAHCHPTDTMPSLDNVAGMKTRGLTIMATRAQDQTLVAEFADELSARHGEQGKILVPSFGWHPWFSHHVYDDLALDATQLSNRNAHYRRVITPTPDDEAFLLSLPEPRPLSALLQEIRDHLQRYPNALVGEIGLDRAFRIPGTEMIEGYEHDPALTPGSREGRRLSPYRVDLEHQRRILTAQLKLAGEMQRAVSVHGVAAHGIVYETLAQTWHGHERSVPSKRKGRREANAAAPQDSVFSADSSTLSNFPLVPMPYPPRICLHSYSGPVDTLRLYLQPSVPATVFFSLSRLVNFSSPSSKKSSEVIKAIPDDRILAESDLHAAGGKMDDLMEDIITTICQIKGWSLRYGTGQLALNWRHFISGYR